MTEICTDSLCANKLDMIYLALREVRDNLKDVNGDNLINCIDSAFLFKEYYPEARVIWNYNPPTMNHLFVKVDDIAIEPSAFIEPDVFYRNFTMQEIFGDKYLPEYDIDVTLVYRLYWWDSQWV